MLVRDDCVDAPGSERALLGVLLEGLERRRHVLRREAQQLEHLPRLPLGVLRQVLVQHHQLVDVVLAPTRNIMLGLDISTEII